MAFSKRGKSEGRKKPSTLRGIGSFLLGPLVGAVVGAIVTLWVSAQLADILPAPKVTGVFAMENAGRCTSYTLVIARAGSPPLDTVWTAVEFPQEVTDYRLVGISHTATSSEVPSALVGKKLSPPIGEDDIECRITNPPQNELPPSIQATLNARKLTIDGRDVQDDIFARFFGKNRMPLTNPPVPTGWYDTKTKYFGLPTRRNIKFTVYAANGPQ